jgi:hypothetical protein
LLGLVRLYPEIVVGYSQLVTITSDSFLEITELKQGVGAAWTFLSDPENRVGKDLDILEYTDPYDLPAIPHTFVLAPGLAIHKIYNGYWYWGRPRPEELALDLREATSQARPDWRIDTPEWRTRWDRGEYDAFWPYGDSILHAIARQYGIAASEVAKMPRPAPEELRELMRRRRQHEKEQPPQ